MRSIFAAFISLTLLVGAVFAQQTAPPANEPGTPQSQMPRSDEPPNQATQPGQPSAQPASNAQATNRLKIAPGSVIPVELTKTNDAKKAKTGDQVVATVTEDMKTSSGEVLVPKDTKVIGHVTEAQARNKEQKESELGIVFNQAIVKGDQMQLPMSIQAVIAPPSNDNAANAGRPESPSAPAAGAPSGSMVGSRPGAMGGTSPAAQQNAPPNGPPESEPQSNSRPAITEKTEGVIGISNVKLENGAQNSQQGSVLTSDKNNVKIEKGTMMLLRVNQ